MKIKIIEASTKKPFVGTKVKIQIKGKNSGFLTISTDQNGEFKIDDKYQGQQLTACIHGSQTPWITISDSLTVQLNDHLFVDKKAE